MDLKCVLHTGDVKGKIILFTEDTLKNCKDKKEIRDATKKKKSKFDVIELPEEPDGISGYHAQCYRYFCSGVKKQPSMNTLGWI